MEWFHVSVQAGSGNDLDVRSKFPTEDCEVNVCLVAVTRNDDRRGLVYAGPLKDGSLGSITQDGVLNLAGLHLVGRWATVRAAQALVSGGLRHQLALADLKMGRLLDSIDEWAAEVPECAELERRERFERALVEDSPALSIDLEKNEIRTILWATGFRPDYSWLDIPVLDRKGRVRHDGGVVDSPGLYVIGLPFLRRRKSSFIHGTEDDARDISEHLLKFLKTR